MEPFEPFTVEMTPHEQLVALRRLAKDRQLEIVRLRKMIEGLTARVAAQSELLARRTEGPPGKPEALA